MVTIRVIIKGRYAFTCDTQEEYNNSTLITVDEKQAESLICGFGIEIQIPKQIEIPNKTKFDITKLNLN